ncbi:MAG: histidine phosphatase family protein [Clostridiales bacterium]|nr:histidine phosphatase family protein [Clostridiales bacterium]
MNNELLDLLRSGGYILYVRHAHADVGEDLPNLDFSNCFTQRNLSQQGRRQAINYGQVLQRLNIPISLPVEASPFCRTAETALLAFGWPNVQTDYFWYGVYRLGENPQEQREALEGFDSRMEMPPPAGSNKVIIAHSFPEGVGLGQIKEMETVIIQPLGEGNGYEIVARIPQEELLN